MSVRRERCPLVVPRRRRSSVYSFAHIVDLLIIAAGDFRGLCQDFYKTLCRVWGGSAGPLFLLPALLVPGQSSSESDRIDYPSSSFVRRFISMLWRAKILGSYGCYGGALILERWLKLVGVV